MAVELWQGATNRGTVLTTQLNSLADATYSALGSVAIDNSVNLDRFGVAELNVTYGTNPTAASPCHLFGVPSLNGTNYEDSTIPAGAYYLGTFQLQANTSAQRIATARFELLPFKLKFILYNNAGQTTAASGNTVTLYTFNRTIG
jgi:hypothetical protein